MAVTIGGSKNFPRPTSKLEEVRLNKVNLAIDLGSISRVNIASISVLVDLGSAEIKFTSSSSGPPLNFTGRLSLLLLRPAASTRSHATV